MDVRIPWDFDSCQGKYKIEDSFMLLQLASKTFVTTDSNFKKDWFREKHSQN